MRRRTGVALALVALAASGCGEAPIDNSPQARMKRLTGESRALTQLIYEANTPCDDQLKKTLVGWMKNSPETMAVEGHKGEQICAEAARKIEVLVAPAEAEPMQRAYFKRAIRYCAEAQALSGEMLGMMANTRPSQAEASHFNEISKQAGQSKRDCVADFDAVTAEFGGTLDPTIRQYLLGHGPVEEMPDLGGKP